MKRLYIVVALVVLLFMGNVSAQDSAQDFDWAALWRAPTSAFS